MVEIRLLVSGPPEDVQLLADILEMAMPDLLCWNNAAVLLSDDMISVEGVSVPLILRNSLVV